jgi:hypothetical protein
MADQITTSNIIPFPRPSYAQELLPNQPLLLVLDADLARTDITVDLARRKLPVLGVANACAAAEALWDSLLAEEEKA